PQQPAAAPSNLRLYLPQTPNPPSTFSTYSRLSEQVCYLVVMGRVTRNTIRGGSESLVESVASPDKIGKKARTRKSPSLLGSVDTSSDPAPPAAANAK
ncbi:hypothetical protein LTR28_007920, partial [Elasticomyces elasticus]